MKYLLTVQTLTGRHATLCLGYLALPTDTFVENLHSVTHWNRRKRRILLLNPGWIAQLCNDDTVGFCGPLIGDEPWWNEATADHATTTTTIVADCLTLTGV